MGDRANVKVVGHGSVVYLYTHWRGSELPQVLEESLLRARDRWDDEQYLARVIFSDLTNGHERSTTGYGISSIVGDGDDRVLVVDVDQQMVYQEDKPNGRVSFDSYAQGGSRHGDESTT